MAVPTCTGRWQNTVAVDEADRFVAARAAWARGPGHVSRRIGIILRLTHGIVGALLGVSLGGAFLDLWAAVVSGVIGFSLGTIFGERGVASICWTIRPPPLWVPPDGTARHGPGILSPRHEASSSARRGGADW